MTYGDIQTEKPAVKVGVCIEQGSGGVDKKKARDLGVLVQDGYNPAWTSDARLELTPDHVRNMVAHEGGGEGGAIFFNGYVERAELKAALVLMRVVPRNPEYHLRDFRIFHHSPRVSDKACLNEFRFVTHRAMKELFGEKEEVKKQEADIFEAIWAIIESERERHPAHSDDGITSTCFGLMVENGAYGVVRLWSRRVFHPK